MNLINRRDKKFEKYQKYFRLEYKEISLDELYNPSKMELYSLSIFNKTFIRDNITGNKDELSIDNSVLKQNQLDSIIVKKETIINNVYFQFVSIKNCRFVDGLFVATKFEDTMIDDVVLTNAVFINCIGMSDVLFSNCKMENCLFINCDVPKDFKKVLEDNKNVVRDIEIIDSLDNLANLPGNKKEEGTADVQQEEIKMIKEENKQKEEKNIQVEEIIKAYTLENKEVSATDFINKIFKHCEFSNLVLGDVDLSSNTDFNSCNFDNVNFSEEVDFYKVSFEGSSFNGCVIKGNYVNCIFTDCHFYNCTITEDTKFINCNFVGSNADEEFTILEKQFINSLIPLSDTHKKEIEQQSDKLNKLLNDLYTYMKEQDDTIVEKEEMIDPDTIVDQKLLVLNDNDWMTFIAQMTAKRVSHQIKETAAALQKEEQTEAEESVDESVM